MTEVISRPANGVSLREPLGRDSINRDVPIPYYYQLEGMLREQVHRGRWLPGQQVPSEKQLCERYEVSRTTVRQAVGHLVLEGLLFHVKGKGTFVRKQSN